MSKVMTIKLRPVYRMTQIVGYLVIQITDSLDYAPEEVIPRNEVAAMCKSKCWKVTIVGAAHA